MHYILNAFFHTIFNARISITCFILYCGPQVNLNKIASDLLSEEAKIPWLLFHHQKHCKQCIWLCVV